MRINENRLRKQIRKIILETTIGGQQHPSHPGFWLIYDSATRNTLSVSDNLGIKPEEGKRLTEWAASSEQVSSGKSFNAKEEGLYVIIEGGKAYAATPFSLWYCSTDNIEFTRAGIKGLPSIDSALRARNILGSFGYMREER